MRFVRTALLALVPLAFLGPAPAQDNARPSPTHADVKYGPHERNVLDFWQAKSDTPTPLVVLIHGGGWVNGDKSGYGTTAIKPFLDAGISVASINYRFIRHGMEDKVEPHARETSLTLLPGLLHNRAVSLSFSSSMSASARLAPCAATISAIFCPRP